MSRKMRVCHIITGLGRGGAESMLHNLLKHTDRDRFDSSVISLLEEGPLGAPIRDLGVRVESLKMTRGLPNPLKIVQLAKKLRTNRIDLAQCWMYHANLLGGIATKWQGIPSVWGIHHSNLTVAANKKSTLRIVRLCANLSPFLPEKIIYCAQKARSVHEEIGYTANKSAVIPNGFEISRFTPSAQARISLREELGLARESLLIGLIARFDPQKDHASFFQAANLLLEKTGDGMNIHFILCGTGVTMDNAEIVALIPQPLLSSGRLHLLGARADMPRIYAALDISTLSSVGEAFPNVLGEAMACAVPCVTTDVGDCAWIVGDTGILVPSARPKELADACLRMIEMGSAERHLMGERARNRIREMFDIVKIADQYANIYLEVGGKSCEK